MNKIGLDKIYCIWVKMEDDDLIFFICMLIRIKILFLMFKNYFCL